MFLHIFSIFLIFGSSYAGDTCVEGLINGLTTAAPSLQQNFQNMLNGIIKLAAGKTFAEMATTFEQTINLVGSGYNGASIQLNKVIESIEQTFSSSSNDINGLCIKIVTSLTVIANKWALIYSVNCNVRDLVLNNTQLLMNNNNVLPQTFVNTYIDTERPMVGGFDDMSVNSKLVGDAISGLTYLNSGNTDSNNDILQQIALSFYQNITPLQKSGDILNQTNLTLLGYKVTSVIDFLAAFAVELNGLIPTYTQLLNTAKMLNNAVTSTSN